jgi:TonB family protein
MDPVTTPSTDPELRLLTDWGTGGLRTRWRDAAVASVIAHLALLTLLAMLPSGVFKAPRRMVEYHRIIPLIAPPFELTQPDPNKGKISKSVNIESLLPRPSIQSPPAARSTTRPAARTPAEQPSASVAPPTPSPKPAPAAPQIAEPPKIETAAVNEGALTKMPIGMPQAPPQIQAEEKPKLAFENPGASSSGPRQGTGKIPVPVGGVAEAIRTMPRSGSGGVTVGDTGSGAGGIGEGLNLPPSPGKVGSNLELLSDPMGVDFRPYMVQVLAAVRRNWFAIMPESAKLGSRGKVSLQFAIDRGGRVPKLVIVGPSGIQALDRAAVAGVSASNPFPPLPTEFRGTQIRLQLVFSYNVPSN